MIYIIFAVMEQNNTNTSWIKRYIKIPFILIMAYIVYMSIFSEYSVATRFELDKKIDSLEQEINTYNDTIRHYSILNERISKDPEAMERVVREQYHMNRPNEDVYVFVEEDDK